MLLICNRAAAADYSPMNQRHFILFVPLCQGRGELFRPETVMITDGPDVLTKSRPGGYNQKNVPAAEGPGPTEFFLQRKKSMANTSVQKTRSGRGLWLLPVAAGAFLLAVLGWFTWRYQSRFAPRTEILGVNCANMTVEEASAALQAAADQVEFVLGDETGEEIVRLPLNAFLQPDQLPHLARDAFARQKEDAGPFDWLLSPGGRVEPALLAGVTNRQIWAVLEEALYGNTPRKAPTDARVELSEEGYLVVEEEPGNLVNLQICTDVLAEAFGSFRSLTGPVGALTAENARIRPVVTADGETVRRITDALEAYTHLSIRLVFAEDSVYELTPEDIWSVSTVEIVGRDVVATPDGEKVRALTDLLAADYGFDGVYAKFHKAEQTREYIYYRVGDTGWKMDREDLAEQVAEALRMQTDAEIAPRYDYTWYWKDYYKYYGVKDTFIEISLDNQYLWAYVDGERVDRYYSDWLTIHQDVCRSPRFKRQSFGFF